MDDNLKAESILIVSKRIEIGEKLLWKYKETGNFGFFPFIHKFFCCKIRHKCYYLERTFKKEGLNFEILIPGIPGMEGAAASWCKIYALQKRLGRYYMKKIFFLHILQ